VVDAVHYGSGMPRALVVASGGGGDAITGAVISRRLAPDAPAVVMTYAWERLSPTSIPGPMSASDYANLRLLAPKVYQITPDSVRRGPGASYLPRLAAELPSELLLLDPDRGAEGLTEQVIGALEAFDLDEVMLVDVGGDILADGSEENLLSPLADALILAACSRVEAPVSVVVCGPGLDGELATEDVYHNLRRTNAQELLSFSTDDYGPVRGIFHWHPSEASGLVAAAARGVRASVGVAQGALVALNSHSATAHLMDLAQAVDGRSIIAELATTLNLVEARTISRDQWQQDRQQAGVARIKSTKPAESDRFEDAMNEARNAGATYVTPRHIASRTGRSADEVRLWLSANWQSRYDPPLVLLVEETNEQATSTGKEDP